MIADRQARPVTVRDLKDVLAVISRTNGSSTARQARTVSYIFGLAEDKNLVVANPVPLLRGNKGSPVIGCSRVFQTMRGCRLGSTRARRSSA